MQQIQNPSRGLEVQQIQNNCRGLEVSKTPSSSNTRMTRGSASSIVQRQSKFVLGGS